MKGKLLDVIITCGVHEKMQNYFFFKIIICISLLVISFSTQGQNLPEPAYKPGKVVLSGTIRNYNPEDKLNPRIGTPGIILQNDPIFIDITEEGTFSQEIPLKYTTQIAFLIGDKRQYILVEPNGNEYHIDIDLHAENKEQQFVYSGPFAEINRDFNHRLTIQPVPYYEDEKVLKDAYGMSPFEFREYCMNDVQRTIKQNNDVANACKEAKRLANMMYAFDVLDYLKHTKYIMQCTAMLMDGISRPESFIKYEDYQLPEGYFDVVKEYPLNDPQAVFCYNFARSIPVLRDFVLIDSQFDVMRYLVDNAPLDDSEKKILTNYIENGLKEQEKNRSADLMPIFTKYNYIANDWRKEELQKTKKRLISIFGKDDLPIFEYMEANFARLYLMDLKPLTEEQELYFSKLTNPICIGVLEDTNRQMKPRKKNTDINKHIVSENPAVEAEETLNAIIDKHKGKVILIDMWATWCSGCRRAIKEYSALKEGMKNDVVFIYLTDHSSPEELWNKLIPDMEGYHYRLGKEQWSYLWNRFELIGLPYHLVVDRDGNISHQFIYVPKDEVKEMLEKVI